VQLWLLHQQTARLLLVLPPAQLLLCMLPRLLQRF
jgi:hypothetical protein